MKQFKTLLLTALVAGSLHAADNKCLSSGVKTKEDLKAKVAEAMLQGQFKPSDVMGHVDMIVKVNEQGKLEVMDIVMDREEALQAFVKKVESLDLFADQCMVNRSFRFKLP